MKKKTVLTIAGSDSSGGAGIQADLKTMHGIGVYGMSAITAVTAQNTTGVKSILKLPGEYLQDQLEMVFTDIFPDAVKIGMTFSKDLMQVIGESLKRYQAKRIVVDPVMVATSGAKLAGDDRIEGMEKYLFPYASLVTPNIPEAEQLLDCSIQSKAEMEEAAKLFAKKYKTAVLIKGGHLLGEKEASDIFCNAHGNLVWYSGKRIENPNTHGTGCTLSSAIASYLALGYGLETSIQKGKAYLEASLKVQLDLGRASGPLWHVRKEKEAE